MLAARRSCRHLLGVLAARIEESFCVGVVAVSTGDFGPLKNFIAL
jgi:hypothetical protein